MNNCDVLCDFEEFMYVLEVNREKLDFVLEIKDLIIMEEMIRFNVEEFLVEEDFKLCFFEV